MVIYQTKVDKMIAAIQAKDVQAIVDKQTYIPTLNKVNNVSQVTNWLNKRVGYLEQAKTLSEAQVQTFVDNYYNGLTVAEQSFADQIMLGEQPEGMTEEEWENTVLFNIYYYITTPED